jgi:hypothetical protein
VPGHSVMSGILMRSLLGNLVANGTLLARF